MSSLQRVCKEDFLFRGSFPIEKMSTDELEAAALGPMRFVSLLTRFGDVQKVGKGSCDQDGKGVPPEVGLACRSRKFLCEIPSRSSIYTPKLFLVPGGRFLIVKSCLALQMWDLGLTVASGKNSGPIMLDMHRCDFENGWEYQFVSSFCISGENIRVVCYGITR